jgi:hypothetical protein
VAKNDVLFIYAIFRVCSRPTMSRP